MTLTQHLLSPNDLLLLSMNSIKDYQGEWNGCSVKFNSGERVTPLTRDARWNSHSGCSGADTEMPPPREVSRRWESEERSPNPGEDTEQSQTPQPAPRRPCSGQSRSRQRRLMCRQKDEKYLAKMGVLPDAKIWKCSWRRESCPRNWKGRRKWYVNNDLQFTEHFISPQGHKVRHDWVSKHALYYFKKEYIIFFLPWMGNLSVFKMCLRKEARGWTDTRNGGHVAFQIGRCKMDSLDYGEMVKSRSVVSDSLRPHGR